MEGTLKSVNASFFFVNHRAKGSDSLAQGPEEMNRRMEDCFPSLCGLAYIHTSFSLVQDLCLSHCCRIKAGRIRVLNEQK